MQLRFVMPAIMWGGGPRNIYSLSNYLASRGHAADVLILTGRRGSTSTRNTVNMSSIRFASTDSAVFHPPLDWINRWTCATAFRHPFLLPAQLVIWSVTAPSWFQQALYIATAWETAYPVQKLSNKYHVPGLYFVQAYEPTFKRSRVWRAYSRSTYRFGLVRFTQSHWLKSFLDNIFGGNTYYIGMGIDHEIFHPISDNVPEQRPRIVTVARVDENKGFRVFVDAISRLRKTRKDFDVIVIGEKSALDYVKPNFHYTYNGWIGEDVKLADLYRGSIFVNTGVQEALPMPPLEAMACGATVVMTDMQGAKEYTQDYHNCLLAPVGDAECLAQKLDEVLSNRSLALELGRQAADTAKRYTWDMVVERFENMLRQENLL